MCGRRWGKTTDGVDWLAEGAIDGERCGWFAPTYKYLADAWRELTHRLRPITRGANATERRIELITGGIIECWTLEDPDAGRGRKYHRIVVDEAGLVPNLLEQWNASLRPTLADYRGKATFYGTPKGRRYGFVVLFQKGEAGDDPEWASFRAPTADNPHIPPEEIEAARRELPPAIFAQEYEGIPADDGTNPFGLAALAECTGPLSTRPVAVWGVDLARAVDWTVAIGLDEHGHVARFERFQRPWIETKGALAALLDDTPAVVDASGVGDAIVQDLQSDPRLMVTGYVFTAPSKLRLMQRLIAAVQGRRIRFPPGPIRAEMEILEYEVYASGIRYHAPEGQHDDCVMALGLALHGYDTMGLSPPNGASVVIRREGQDPVMDPFDHAHRHQLDGHAVGADQFPESF